MSMSCKTAQVFGNGRSRAGPLCLASRLTRLFYVLVRGPPVRISSMVLLVAYAFYYRNVVMVLRCSQNQGLEGRAALVFASHVPSVGEPRDLRAASQSVA